MRPVRVAAIGITTVAGATGDLFARMDALLVLHPALGMADAALLGRRRGHGRADQHETDKRQAELHATLAP